MVLEGRLVSGSCLSCIFLFLSTFPGDIVAESLEDVTDLHDESPEDVTDIHDESPEDVTDLHYDDDDNTNLHLQLQG